MSHDFDHQEDRREEVVQLLKQIREPNLNNDIISLGVVRNLRIVNDCVYLKLYVGTQQLFLQEQVKLILNKLPWSKKSSIELCTIPGVRTTLAVSSGKGGVGKSTISVNLAAALTLQGLKVGLLDADIYGPNVPHMLGLQQLEVEVIETPTGQRFLPLEAYGIKVMSVGLLAESDRPLAWTSPVLQKIITQFIQEVEWGDLDYLIIDLPPGTGDAKMTIVQDSPICGVILVTTPQEVAIADVRRSVAMFRQIGIPVLGIIENMSYLMCGHCSQPTPIFGRGGGEKLAKELQTPLLGQVPIEAKICTGGDLGHPLVVFDSSSKVSQVFSQIATAIETRFLGYFSEIDS